MVQGVQAPPLTPVEPVTEVLHGVEITDPYRWLEDQNSPQTRTWLEEQSAYTRAYFAAIPERELIRTRVRELLALKEVISDPWNVGERYFFLKRQEGREQPVIVMRNGVFGSETVLVDPALRRSGNATAVAIVAISRDGRFLAYSVRQGGTDHSSLEVIEVEQAKVLADRLPEGFCTGFVFAPDDSGFYYSHRERNDPRPNYRAAFFHRFGTEREQDQKVFFAGEEPDLFLGILDSPEAKILAFVVFSTGKLRRTSIYLQRVPFEFRGSALLVRDIEGCLVPFFVRGQLFAYTDMRAPNFRIVRINMDDPDPSHWHDVVPETDRRIQQFAVAADEIFVSRVNRFSTRVEMFSIDGMRRETTLFPRYATVNFLNRICSSSKLFYSRTSISEPAAISYYEPIGNQVFALDETTIRLDLPSIAVEETEFISKDGTLVPMFLAGRQELLHSGALPTFLTGYGGFGSCVTPRFTVFATFLMEQGFLFAVPALRGGSELGEQWHLAGKREHRQNAFDDFIAAAGWLIAEGRSVAGQIAIGGGSNAGLLVGAAITQRPNLFRAAICLGPLLDMTRYHLYDLASGWADEYGSPQDEQDLHSLLGYSPYHHVKDRAAYPAVLLISGDADTRCNPMHARKMASRLQAATSSAHPILLDYKTHWGHTPVQPLSAKIEALADRLAFVCHELRVSLQRRSCL